MTMDFTLVTLVADLATLFLLFLSLVFTAGIVWRVEKELDVSYKFFLAALVVLLLAESLGKFFSETQVYAMISSMLKVVFGLLLLVGVWTMRDIVRKLDGEKDKKV
jgi:uncharacterized membrane protein